MKKEKVEYFCPKHKKIVEWTFGETMGAPSGLRSWQGEVSEPQRFCAECGTPVVMLRKQNKSKKMKL